MNSQKEDTQNKDKEMSYITWQRQDSQDSMYYLVKGKIVESKLWAGGHWSWSSRIQTEDGKDHSVPVYPNAMNFYKTLREALRALHNEDFINLGTTQKYIRNPFFSGVKKW